jgi:DNA-3-methyladenine glycosylase
MGATPLKDILGGVLPIPQEFYKQPTEHIARDLLGKVLVWRPTPAHISEGIDDLTLAGRIVETEAYLHIGDAASHSARGCTPRNEAMFAAGGILYVYKIYGIRHCINVVTEEEGKGCAVLIRALEPLLGIPFMQQQRGVEDVRRLCNGPGNLAQAFGFTLAQNRLSLGTSNLCICSLPDAKRLIDEIIATTTRIGITKDVHLPLRFFLKENIFVSRGKPSSIRKPS